MTTRSTDYEKQAVGFKEVSKDDFYAVVNPLPGIGSIVNSYERRGRGYITHFHQGHPGSRVIAISHSGDFPFTEKKYFIIKEQTMPIENECDGSGPHSGNETRCLPTGGGGNVILCRACFAREIAWRKERNESRINPVANKFDLPAWEQCKIYKGAQK